MLSHLQYLNNLQTPTPPPGPTPQPAFVETGGGWGGYYNWGRPLEWGRESKRPIVWEEPEPIPSTEMLDAILEDYAEGRPPHPLLEQILSTAPSPDTYEGPAVRALRERIKELSSQVGEQSEALQRLGKEMDLLKVSNVALAALVLSQKRVIGTQQLAIVGAALLVLWLISKARW